MREGAKKGYGYEKIHSKAIISLSQLSYALRAKKSIPMLDAVLSVTESYRRLAAILSLKSLHE